jgi:DNA repair exonuclease SbcCD nuclease subunit
MCNINRVFTITLISMQNRYPARVTTPVHSAIESETPRWFERINGIFQRYVAVRPIRLYGLLQEAIVFTFIHAADIHLDSPLRGLSRYEGAPVERIRGATREALNNLVQTAIDENAAFVIIAGDIFDGDWKDYNTGLFFASHMSRLRENGIQVFLLSGNHDAAGKITRTLKMPDNVVRFPTKHAKTFILEACGVAIHGQGFSRPDVTENLAAGYPAAVEGLYNIGVLHTAATGREGHEPYAPCNMEDLIGKGYDYWALGHIHKREILHESPWILFPGNPQGRHVRESGPKGCMIATVDDERSTRVEMKRLDVICWAGLRVDCTGVRSGDGVVASVRSALEDELAHTEGRMLAARVEVYGSCRAHEALTSDPEKWINQIRAEATDVSGGELWLEKVLLHTTLSVDLKKLVAGESPVSHLLNFMNDLESDPMELSGLAELLANFKSKLPLELRSGEDAIDLESPERIREILEEARQLLLPHLLAKGLDQ